MVVTVGLHFHMEGDISRRHASIRADNADREAPMKRWLVILLVALALLVLLAPGIVGRMAERNIDRNIEWAESDSPGLSIRTESFDRGWFTSEGRYRVGFEGGQFAEITEEYRQATGNQELPSLIIDTRLSHGPLPGGSVPPGLASTVSTFQLDPGNGAPIDIPGTLTSRVGLDGASKSHLLLEAGTFRQDGVTIGWQGADIDISSNPATGAINAAGDIKPWKIEADGSSVDIGTITVAADQRDSEFGFSVGTVDLAVGEIRLVDESSSFSIAGMSMKADSGIEDERLTVHSVFGLQAMTVPAFGDVGFDMDFSLLGADAASVAVIGNAVQEAQGAADPEQAMANLYSEIENEVQALFLRGFRMRFDRLDVTLPQGLISMKLDIDVPESDDDAGFEWGSILLKTSGSLDVKIPSTVYEMAAMMNAQAGSLVAMGLLVQEGDDYVMKAEYTQGLINVNGAPMPIPIPVQ